MQYWSVQYQDFKKHISLAVKIHKIMSDRRILYEFHKALNLVRTFALELSYNLPLEPLVT